MQYRPIIFYHDQNQKALAEAYKKRLMQSRKETINVQILPVGPFYPAEDYHQKYYQKNPIRYRFYRYTCGRDQRLKELWTPS